MLQFHQFLREIIFNGNRPLLQKGHTEKIFKAKINKGRCINWILLTFLKIEVKICREYLLAAASHPFFSICSMKYL